MSPYPTRGFDPALGIVFVIAIAIGLVVLWAQVKVLNKAGFSGWYVLLTLTPFVGSLMVVLFAVADWPVHQELRALRARAGHAETAP